MNAIIINLREEEKQINKKKKNLLSYSINLI
jgi:hypothetical protein